MAAARHKQSATLGADGIMSLQGGCVPGGIALLYYPSLFYHHVMVKLARHEGFDVRTHGPAMLTPSEAASVYNYYLARVLRREGIEEDALRFELNREKLGCFGVKTDVEPLLPGNSRGHFPGMIAIERAQ